MIDALFYSFDLTEPVLVVDRESFISHSISNRTTQWIMVKLLTSLIFFILGVLHNAYIQDMNLEAHIYLYSSKLTDTVFFNTPWILLFVLISLDWPKVYSFQKYSNKRVSQGTMICDAQDRNTPYIFTVQFQFSTSLYNN